MIFAFAPRHRIFPVLLVEQRYFFVVVIDILQPVHADATAQQLLPEGGAQVFEVAGDVADSFGALREDEL